MKAVRTVFGYVSPIIVVVLVCITISFCFAKFPAIQQMFDLMKSDSEDAKFWEENYRDARPKQLFSFTA